MKKNNKTEQLMEQAERETEGMDFTYIVDQTLGRELTENQRKTKESFDEVVKKVKMKETLYRIQLNGKWINPIYVLGQWMYRFCDNEEDAKAFTCQKAYSIAGLIAEDNQLAESDLTLIEVTNKQHLYDS
ncbi:MAG: hypothetical protein K6E62_12410 [Lachnospiraceae bacterium]|nr:hypothetical protein [Lachnospiraceae bacterium]